MMMRKFALASVTAIALFATSCSRENTSDLDQSNETDRNFATMASMGNHAEIAAGTTAMNKGVDSSIRMFGQMMVNEHYAAQADLKRIASMMSMMIPEGLDSMHLAMNQQLAAVPAGFTFDSTYIHSQVMDHQKTITLFQNEIANGKNPALVNYAQKYLPKIQMHYQHADTIADRF
ncbi:MAG: DUF4142 domain-containing protein [Sphingobacteriales bacterium]|nr:MAG: DUF4142 domain-containing protein [Sphingobacteriales bacterium]